MSITSRPITRWRGPAAAATTLALAAGAVVLAVQPAHAAVTRHEGVVKFTSALNCESVIGNYPYYEPGAGAVANVLYDDAAPPRAGDVFYVGVQVAAVGNPYPCLDQSMRPDLTLPSGVSLAISTATPIRCVRWNYKVTPATETPETDLCPSAASAPQSGGTVGFDTAAGDVWTIPTGVGYEVQVPVVASAAGIRTFTFPVRVVDGNSNPILKPVSGPVQVGPAPVSPSTTTPTTAPTPAPTTTPPTTEPTTPEVSSVSIDVPSKVRLGSTRGKVKASVEVQPAGSDVKVSLFAKVSRKWVRIGKRSYHAGTAAPTPVVIRVARRWQSRATVKPLRARILAVATSPTGATASSTAKLKMLR
jgi:hypothetical protein